MRTRRIERRDLFLTWTNPQSLRMAGTRVGPNRMRRMARARRAINRHVSMVLKRMGY